jgi:hypothetical protein
MEVLDVTHGGQVWRSIYYDIEEEWIRVFKSTNKLGRLFNTVDVLEKWVGNGYDVFKRKGCSRHILGGDSILWDIYLEIR